MSTLVRRAGSPAALALNEEDLTAKSAAVLQAAGYRMIPLAHAIGPWALLGTCTQGLVLCAVVRDHYPDTLGVALGLPAGWPIYVRRLVHVWKPDAPLPEALSL
jgi:hypothetical protein